MDGYPGCRSPIPIHPAPWSLPGHDPMPAFTTIILRHDLSRDCSGALAHCAGAIVGGEKEGLPLPVSPYLFALYDLRIDDVCYVSLTTARTEDDFHIRSFRLLRLGSLCSCGCTCIVGMGYVRPWARLASSRVVCRHPVRTRCIVH